MIPEPFFLLSMLLALFARNVSGQDNFHCSQAVQIDPDGDVVYGTNRSDLETLDSVETTCSEAWQDDVRTSQAWWYVVEGNGEVIRAHTCSNVTDFDTIITVYRGDCENLECVGHNDDSWCDSSFSPSMVEWKTEQSVDYYVRIFGFSGDSGDFRLEFSSFQSTANDFCDGAIALNIEAESSILGTANNSLSESFQCGGFNEELISGVWYSILGTGGALVISTCSDLYDPPYIYVFSGTCDELECVSIGLNITTGFCEQSALGGYQAIFTTEVNTEYFLLVGRCGCENPYLDFELTVSEIALPPNGLCSEAIELVPDTDTTVGSLINATTMHTNTSCTYIDMQRVVWYSLMGTGDILVISTCSEELDFESTIVVTSGTCDDQECVTFSEDEYCSLSTYTAARAVFKSETGTQYQVMVGLSFGATNGNFGITVTSVQVPPNSVCSNALVVQTDNGTVTGLIQNVSGYEPYPSYVAWFSLVGSGEEYEITTCSSNLNFDAAIYILTGTCEDPRTIIQAASNDYVCSKSPYQSARVILLTEPGVRYYIAVEPLNHELTDSQGEFGLTISTVEVIPKYVCSGAILIQPEDGIIQGTLANATKFSGVNNSCTPNGNTPSAWFSLLGTGDVFAISTCSRELNFDSVMSVSTGSCNEQQCASYNSSNDLDCSYSTYVASRVVLPTEIGVEYWIAVHGLTLTNIVSSQEGRFSLTISSVLPSPNEFMESDEFENVEGTTGNETKNVSTSLLPRNGSKAGDGNSDPVPFGPSNSSLMTEYLSKKSGCDRRDLFPSLLVAISIVTLGWMMNA